MSEEIRNKKIKMRELEALTNLPRATINYYIKEGLLPYPQKSAKNMAYYDDDFVEKLKFIDNMRKSDFTLSQIKRLIHYDVNTVNEFGLQVLESVNRLLPYGIDECPVTLEQIKSVGFSDDDMDTLLKLRIITPLNNERTLFPAYSITVCRFVKYYLDIGVPVSTAQDILNKIKELADLEKNVFINYIRSPMLDQHIAQEEQKKEVQKCIENINSLLPILHLQFIKAPSEELRKLE